MLDARRQNGCPTPPWPATASQSVAGVVMPPDAKLPQPLPRFDGVPPVVSRRPRINSDGPQIPTVPTFHRDSRSAHGVVHWPAKTLPNGPCRPADALRDPAPTAAEASHSGG